MTRAQVDEMESVEPDLTASAGLYQLKFSLGTPPIEILAAAATGSAFMWVQCKATGAANVPAVFNPDKSKTYAKLLYDQPICKAQQRKFGKEAKILGKVTASIPDGPHYTLILVGVSYGGTELKPKQGEGEVIIDSGAENTKSPDALYDDLTTRIIRRALDLNRRRMSWETLSW